MNEWRDHNVIVAIHTCNCVRDIGSDVIIAMAFHNFHL